MQVPVSRHQRIDPATTGETQRVRGTVGDPIGSASLIEERSR
jgi:hypothetical protein